MNLGVKNYAVLNIGGIEIWITETLVNMWIVMLILTVFAIVVRMTLKKFETIPKGFQNIVELLVESFDKFVISNAGEELLSIGGWFFMIFAFVFVSNISGIFGLRAPTADWAVTFAVSIATFVIIQIMGIKHRKGAYFKSFLEPTPLLLPLNIISEISRPISLSFRLFGNVLSGVILLTLVYTLTPVYVRFVIPAALHAYFDLISGALQTYIFCVLSFSFIKGAAVPYE